MRTDDPVLDVQPIVDRIHELFLGPDGEFELYGLGPGRPTVGRRVAPLTVDRDPAACWNHDVDATAGAVGEVEGWIEPDDGGERRIPFAIVVDGRVVGTSRTNDSGDHVNRVIALADPEAWPDDPADVSLWRVVDPEERDGGGSSVPGLVRLPACD